jgi:hypothetical protein
MNITSAQYIAEELIVNDALQNGDNISIKATIDGIEMVVPLDPANRHYAAILEWVADGNTIQDAD